jgi:hypothetical protein
LSVNSGHVQRFLRDYTQNNILLDSVQFEEEDIRDATTFAIAEYNAMTPITSVTEDNFPNDWVLLMGICAHLMMSESFLQLRNQATYQDGDIQNIGVDDKFNFYNQLAQQLKSDWKSVAQKIKQQKNMEQAYDSLSSGYRFLYPGFRGGNS